MPGEHVDLSSELPRAEQTTGLARPFLGVRFACCGVYARVYRNAEATAYVGHCPRCRRPLRVEIAAGGTDQRFFTVS